MDERIVILQYVINQRGERPTGRRIWSDGFVQRCADDAPPPGAADRLDRDRDLPWQDTSELTIAELETLQNAVQQSGFFELPAALLINYCKEDPGTAIWTVNVGGRTARVVVFDPRPHRNPVIDHLTAVLDGILSGS